MSNLTRTTGREPQFQAILDAAEALIAEHPDAAPLLRQAMTHLTEAAQYPELLPVEVEDDGEMFAGVRCPWCDELVSEDEDEGLVVVDQGDRWTPVTPDEYDHERQSISVDYEGHADYEGLHYLHGACSQPVRLPEGWHEA